MPQRHKGRDSAGRKEKNEWGNINVDNSICPRWVWAQSLWGVPLLKAENGHNSIETWLRLRLLPLSRHTSREYFMPSPPRDGEQSKSNVCFLSRRFPSAARTFLLCWLMKVLLLTGSGCALWMVIFVPLPGCIIGRTSNFSLSQLRLFPWQIG